MFELLIATTAAGITGLGMHIFPKKIGIRTSNVLFLIWAVLLFVSYCIFIASLLTSDSAFVYSAEKVSESSALIERLIAIFSAGTGAMFFLTVVSTALSGFAALQLKHAKFRRLFFSFHYTFSLFLLFGLLFSGDFLPSSPDTSFHGIHPFLNTALTAIHPVFLFSGYAAVFVLFNLTVSGLLSGDFSSVNRKAKEYEVLAFILLGAGLSAGGLWAYRTPGWGGWWCWDPVEVSALIPFLALSAGILNERKSGTKSKLIIRLLPFGLVLLSVVLIRSGVFSGISVHSYSGINKPAVIAGTFLITGYIVISIIALRYKKFTHSGISFGEIGFSVLILHCLIVMAFYLFPEAGHLFDFDFNNPGAYHLAVLIPAVSGILLFDSVRVLRRISGTPGIIALSFTIAFGIPGLIKSIGIDSFEVLLPSGLFAFNIAIKILVAVFDKDFNRKRIGKLIMLTGAGLLIFGALSADKEQVTKVLVVSGEVTGQIGKKEITFKDISEDKESVTTVLEENKDILKITRKKYRGNNFKIEDRVIYSGIKEDIVVTLKEFEQSGAEIELSTVPMMFWIFFGAALLAVGAVLSYRLD